MFYTASNESLKKKWSDLLGWECIQTRQKQTRQEHEEGGFGGGERAKVIID